MQIIRHCGQKLCKSQSTMLRTKVNRFAGFVRSGNSKCEHCASKMQQRLSDRKGTHWDGQRGKDGGRETLHTVDPLQKLPVSISSSILLLLPFRQRIRFVPENPGHCSGSSLIFYIKNAYLKHPNLRWSVFTSHRF